MCTAMTIQVPEGRTYFGRTMDYWYPLNPELYLISEGFEWNNLLNTHKIYNRYRVMGIGQDISPVILADGVNEMGFAAAVLYFPGYAEYDSADQQDSEKPCIAALELVNFLLGQCADVKEAASMLPMLRIVGTKDLVTGTIAPLHWIIADRMGNCMVIEREKDGLHLLENPIGVLTNSPDFSWQMTNLRNYMNVKPDQSQEEVWNTVKLMPFGQGTGTIGLPGGYTPPARFVRTAYQKSHADFPGDNKGAVMTCFHIMENVSIPKGVVVTERGTPDYTQYTMFIDLSRKEYYFKTYDNSQITAVQMPDGYEASIRSLGKLTRPISFEIRNG